MPWGLKRYYGTGSLHFITWSCHRRKPLLCHPARRDLLLTVLELMRVRTGGPLFACTIRTEGAPSLRFLQGWAAMLRVLFDFVVDT